MRNPLRDRWWSSEARYWERFDPNFFKEKSYRRIIWRYMLGFLAVPVGIAVYGGFEIAAGRGRGWLLILGAFCLLMGVRSMGSWLFKTRDLADRE